jgi:alkylation response protein AidB-like acyl-CoA dehydrogenase
VDFTLDAFGRELETGLRKQLAALGDATADLEELWAALTEFELPGLEAPAEVGGLDLGLSCGVVAWEELGAALARSPLLDTVFALECVLESGPSGPLWTLAPRLADGTVRATATGLDTVDPAAAATTVSTVDGTVIFPGTRADPPPGLLDRPLMRARIRQAAYLVGMARCVLDTTTGYVREREQFGQRLVDFQAVSFPLATALIKLEATRLLVRRAAWLADRREPPTPTPPTPLTPTPLTPTPLTPALPAVEALASAADLAGEAVQLAVHLHGTRGMLRANPVSRAYLHAREEITRLGTPPVLWRLAGRLRLDGPDDRDDRAAIC